MAEFMTCVTSHDVMTNKKKCHHLEEVEGCLLNEKQLKYITMKKPSGGGGPFISLVPWGYEFACTSDSLKWMTSLLCGK